MSHGDGGSHGGPGNYWRRNSTPFSRIVNPELHTKPNLTVGLLGTALFAILLSNLFWQRHSMQKQREVRAQMTPKPASRSVEVLHEDD